MVIFEHLIESVFYQMVTEMFHKNEVVATERADKEKKHRDETERKRKARVAKKAEEERKRQELLAGDGDGPQIQEVTDEEAERIQKEIDAVNIGVCVMDVSGMNESGVPWKSGNIWKKRSTFSSQGIKKSFTLHSLEIVAGLCKSILVTFQIHCFAWWQAFTCI